MKCKKCNQTVHAYKKTLKPYGYCLNCLPEQYRCRAKRVLGGKCHYPKVQGEDTCTKHREKTTMKKMRGKEGYVYLIDLGFDNLYKIGIAKRPLVRLATLKASNPRAKMRHRVKVDAMKWAERECHVKFSSNHYERELFTFSASEVSKVISFMNNLPQI